jgi:hypothetical protein
MIKAHYYLAGRIDWNECRSSNHQSIIEVMEENLEGLRAVRASCLSLPAPNDCANLGSSAQDNAVVEQTQFGPIIPDLQARRAALLAELHEERQRDLELSACDQEELGSMHAAMVEQAYVFTLRCSRRRQLADFWIRRDELEKLERGYNEVAIQLAGLTARAEELAANAAKSMEDKDDLQRKLEEGRCFTKVEVFRLQGASLPPVFRNRGR